MKRFKHELFLVLAVLLISAICRADPIPFGNFIVTNQAGGTVSYLQAIGGSTLSGSGDGWLFSTGIGINASGSLDVTTSQFSLEGELSRIYFNVKTGLLQAQFVGQLRWPTGVFHVYHAVFYESIDLAHKTTLGGHVVISEAPEPGTIWLMLSGIVGVIAKRLL